MERHSSATVCRAYAKINLFLDMIGRMENGYHEVCSVMQSVGLYDTISVAHLTRGKGIRLTSDCKALPCDRRNLAFRAAEAFREAFDVPCDVEIRIEKRIPMAAGMAGGSSDAAAVLRGLNRLFGLQKTTEELCALGMTLGADVPFCIRGGAALAGGIGEKLTSCTGLPSNLPMVVACGGEPVYTPAAYRALDEKYGDFAARRESTTARCEALAGALRCGEVSAICGGLYNIFEEVVLPQHDVAPGVMAKMREMGARGVLMSGSGPSVFGIFDTPEAAQAAAGALRGAFDVFAEAVYPVEADPQS